MSKDICRYNRGKDHNYTCELSHLARYGDKTYYGTCEHEPCPCLLSKIKSLEDENKKLLLLVNKKGLN